MSEPGMLEDLKKAEISSGINATILLTFLMGIYTMIYFGTIYVYFTRQSSNRRFVLATITFLFFTNIVQTAVTWYQTKGLYINNGGTLSQDSVFQSLYFGPQWLTLVPFLLSCVAFVLADALLIWRCFFAWDRSFLMISVPLLFIMTEAALFLIAGVFHIIYSDQTVSAAVAHRSNDLLAATYFLSFATSLITTILIAYRIYSVVNQGETFERRFKHIIDIVVQSGVVYSLSLFVAAMGVIFPRVTNVFNERTVAFLDYVQSLADPIAGMSTTIMVARVALLVPGTTFPSTSVHLSLPLSSLHFHVRSTRQTDTLDEMEINNSIDVDRNSAREGHVKGKAK